MIKWLQGATVVGIAEFDGDLYNPDGIDICGLDQWKLRNGSVVGFPGAQAWDKSKGELIEQECDILGVCAKEKVAKFIQFFDRNVSKCKFFICLYGFQVITAENACRIKAKIVSEGANGPVTPAAHKILLDNKVSTYVKISFDESFIFEGVGAPRFVFERRGCHRFLL